MPPGSGSDDTPFILRPRFVGTMAVVSIAAIQGLAIAAYDQNAAGLIMALGYLLLVFQAPYIGAMITLIVLYDAFGLINPLTFIHIPGFFKLKDLLFIPLFFPCIFINRWRKRSIRLIREHIGILSPILVIVIMALAQMVVTAFEYDLPIGSTIMAGRRYLYYLFMPLMGVYLDTDRKVHIFYCFLLTSAVVASVIDIAQIICLTFNGPLFIAKSFRVTMGYGFGDLPLARIYTPGGAWISFGFGVLLSYLIYFTDRSRLYLLGTALCLLSILLTNSRMGWMQALIIIFIIFKHRYRFYTFMKSLRLSYLLCFFAGGAVMLLWVFSGTSMVESLSKRSASAVTDVLYNKGSWQFRIEDSMPRIELCQKHPLFGVGFVHMYYAQKLGLAGVRHGKDSPPDQGVATDDSGIMTLLVDFGLAGVLWILWYWSVMLKLMTPAAYSSHHALFVRAIGLRAIFISAILTFVTLDLFPSEAAACLSAFLGCFLADSILRNTLLSQRH